jgi:hypothetical protein
VGNIFTNSRYSHTRRYDDIKNKSKRNTISTSSIHRISNKTEVLRRRRRMSENDIIKSTDFNTNSIVSYNEDLDDIEKELSNKITSNVEVFFC